MALLTGIHSNISALFTLSNSVHQHLNTGGSTIEIKFNFSNLKNLYISALHSFDKSMAFDLEYGKGRFLFMMFLSQEDKDAKDNLFVYMRNTKVMRKIKMYGKHVRGDFQVYISNELKVQFIQELQLESHEGNFDFLAFLTALNNKIPFEVSPAEKTKTIRDNRELYKSYTNEKEKTVLIGDRHLSVGEPNDKTLRKLFLYTDSPYEEITELISELKRTNRTVCWTTEDKSHKASTIRKIISSMQSN